MTPPVSGGVPEQGLREELRKQLERALDGNLDALTTLNRFAHLVCPAALERPRPAPKWRWCRCQGIDPISHVHYAESPNRCARCQCDGFVGWPRAGYDTLGAALPAEPEREFCHRFMRALGFGPGGMLDSLDAIAEFHREAVQIAGEASRVPAEHAPPDLSGVGRPLGGVGGP